MRASVCERERKGGRDTDRERLEHNPALINWLSQDGRRLERETYSG